MKLSYKEIKGPTHIELCVTGNYPETFDDEVELLIELSRHARVEALL
jgi:hypothetical protein